MAHHDQPHEVKPHIHHIIPVRTYLLVFAGLMVLLVLTVAAAFVHLGGFDRAVTLIIAAAKAALIMAFFMHLRYSQPLSIVFAGVGFVWLMILLLITLSDYLARGGVVPAS
jgi:cytochrome c oxidase subunit 4